MNDEGRRDGIVVYMVYEIELTICRDDLPKFSISQPASKRAFFFSYRLQLVINIFGLSSFCGFSSYHLANFSVFLQYKSVHGFDREIINLLVSGGYRDKKGSKPLANDGTRKTMVLM